MSIFFEKINNPVSYKSFAVVGSRVLVSFLYTLDQEKAYSHNYSKEFAYDPRTGQPLWKITSKPIEGYDGRSLKINKLDYFNVLECDKYAYIGMIAGEDYYSTWEKRYLPTDLSKFKNQLKEVLSEKNLWSENDYGLWTVLKKE